MSDPADGATRLVSSRFRLSAFIRRRTTAVVLVVIAAGAAMGALIAFGWRAERASGHPTIAFACQNAGFAGPLSPACPRKR
jgi:hypothetical protein